MVLGADIRALVLHCSKSRRALKVSGLPVLAAEGCAFCFRKIKGSLSAGLS